MECCSATITNRDSTPQKQFLSRFRPFLKEIRNHLKRLKYRLLDNIFLLILKATLIVRFKFSQLCQFFFMYFASPREENFVKQ